MVLDECPMFASAYMGHPSREEGLVLSSDHNVWIAGRSSSRGVSRMPQAGLGVFFVPFSIRITDQLKLHSPRREKVNPRLPRVGPGGSDSWLAQKLNTLGGKISHCGIEIIDIKSQMMTTYIAVPGHR